MTNRYNHKNSLLPSIGLFVLFIAYTVVITVVDVKEIGPYHSGVGMGTINKQFADLIGVHMLWYHITNILGILALMIAAFFGLVGALQLVKRKSLLKVDRDILILGCFYVAVIACYVLFGHFAINYRPVMLDGELESSYPSSHTMLAICVMATAILQLRWKMKDDQTSRMVQIILGILILLTVIGRLLSGVHWFTDIIGGVLLSAVLVSLYYWFVMEAGGPHQHKAVKNPTRGRQQHPHPQRTASSRRTENRKTSPARRGAKGTQKPPARRPAAAPQKQPLPVVPEERPLHVPHKPVWSGQKSSSGTPRPERTDDALHQSFPQDPHLK